MTAAAMIIVALTVIVPNYGAFSLNGKWQSHFASAESLMTLFTANPKPVAEQTLQIAETKPVAIAPEEDIQDNAVSAEASQDSTMLSASTVEPVEQVQENNVEVPAMQTSTVQEPVTHEPAMQEKVVEEAVAESSPEVKGYCVVMASAITHNGAEHLISKLNKEGFMNAVKYDDNGMLRVVLVGYDSEEAARADMAVVRATDKLYSGSWLKQF